MANANRYNIEIVVDPEYSILKGVVTRSIMSETHPGIVLRQDRRTYSHQWTPNTENGEDYVIGNYPENDEDNLNEAVGELFAHIQDDFDRNWS